MKFKIKTRYLLLLLGLLFISEAAICQSTTYTPDWIAKHDQVRELFKVEDYEGILKMQNSLLPEASDKKDSISAKLYYYIGTAAYMEGDLDAAISLFEKELELRKVLDGPSHPYYGNLLSNLAFYYEEAGSLEKAEAMYLELMEVDLKNHGNQSEEYVMTAVSLSKFYQDIDRFKDSEKIYQEVLKVLKKDNAYYPVVLANMGSLFTATAQYGKAEKAFQDAMLSFGAQSGEQTVNFAMTLNGIGELYRNTGRYPMAEEALEKAMNILRRSPEDNIEEIGAVSNTLALVYFALGQNDKALSMFEEIAALDKESFGEDHIYYANSLINMGTVLVALDRDEEAIENYKKAQEIIERSLGKDNAYFTATLNNKGFAYRKTKRYQQSLEMYQQALALQKKMYGVKHPEYAKSLFNLGNLYLSMGDYKNAGKQLEQSLKIRKASIGPDHPRFAESSAKMALYYWNLKKIKQAEEFYKTTFNNYFTQIERYFPALSEQEKARFYNQKVRLTFEEFNSFAIANRDTRPSLLGDMYDYQLATKALIMYATNKVRESIKSSGDEELTNTYNEWLSLKEDISQRYSTASSAEDRQEIERLNNEANRLEKILSQKSALFAETYDQKRVSWRDIQKQLKGDEAAIEIIRFRQFLPDSSGRFTNNIYYAALVVDKNTINHPRLVLFDNGKQLETRFLANYRNSIRFKINEEYSYKTYWNPIGQSLSPDTKKVYISPDGVFNQLSINTLRNPGTGNFLVDEIFIQVVTNTKDLLARRSSDDNLMQTGKAQLIGFPNYNKGMEKEQEAAIALAKQLSESVPLDRGLRGTLRGSLRSYLRGDESMVMLPGTKREVETISELFDKAENNNYIAITGDEAVESIVKRAQSPTVLHIATHGFFLEDEEPDPDAREDMYVENPMLRSGLILAGANNFLLSGAAALDEDGQDGILTAYEAMNLNLDNTELVVLSACETGLGTVKNGEGVYGLQRAFRVAGAKTVIMSMWAVDDDATQELMTFFYEEWLKNSNKQEAFRMAQQRLKEKYKYPFYWGAFVMVGD